MTSNRKKFIMGGVAVALAGVLTVGGIATRMNNVVVQASPSLDGIEEIISKNSAEAPFTILEIVPTANVTVSETDAVGGQLHLSTGTVGWLISGNEPMRPELTLQQLNGTVKRDEFMTKVETMLKETKLVYDDGSGALKWEKYEEKNADEWAVLPDADKLKYKKFSADGAQQLAGTMTSKGDYSGNYVKRYVNPSADGNPNTVASDFFEKNDQTKLMKDPANGGPFDPNFILDSREEAGTGLYFVEFAQQANAKRGAFRVLSEKAYTIEEGAAWGSLALAQNTILYQKDDEGRYHSPKYLYKDADGKIALSSIPMDVSDYAFATADGRDVIFKDMRRNAAENPTDPEYGEEEPAGEPDTTSENRSVSEGEVPEAPEETISENVPEPPANNEEPAGAEVTLYNVVFGYTESIVEDTEQLYMVSAYSRMADDTPADKRGIPYKVMDSEPLVCNYGHKGSVNHATGMDSEPWIMFEKTEFGNYSLSTGGTSYWIKGTDIYYTGGFINNDWFKSWVFDLDDSQEDRDKMNIQVYTVSAADVTIPDVEKADLVYLSAGNRGLVANGGFMPEYAGLTLPGYTDKLDIKKEVSTTLLYQAAMRNLPVMTDYELVKQTDTAVRGTYAWKAAYVLAAADVKAAYNKYVSSFSTDGIIQMTDKDHTWVNKNVYIFNDFVQETLGHTILNENFKTDKSDKSYIDDGLLEVKKKIEDTNSSRSSSRKITNTKIDEATIIRHILDYGRVGALAAKDDIYILELEPTNMGFSGTDEHWGTTGVSLVYDLSVREETVGNTKKSTLEYCKHDNFADSTKPAEHTKIDLLTTNGNIHLTQMGTQEFVGKIDDLNSTYDMIFIGDDSTGLYHVTKDANTSTKFNDATMNGLVYFNVGDYAYVDDNRLMGALASEYKRNALSHNWDDLYRNTDYKAEDDDDHPDTTIGRTRYSGNDIRKSDIDYIYNFAKADFPILLGDNLMKEDPSTHKRTVNEDYVDNTSHMCEMIEKILDDKGTEDNLFRIADLRDDTSTAKARRKKLEESLGIVKPSIVFIDPDLTQGDKWEVKTGSSIDGSDKNFIEVKFRIDDPGSNSDYTAKAFIDLNADGKYATNEEIGGAAIRIYDSSSAVERTSLHPGTEYRIVCELNDAPVGDRKSVV